MTPEKVDCVPRNVLPPEEGEHLGKGRRARSHTKDVNRTLVEWASFGTRTDR